MVNYLPNFCSLTHPHHLITLWVGDLMRPVRTHWRIKPLALGGKGLIHPGRLRRPVAPALAVISHKLWERAKSGRGCILCEETKNPPPNADVTNVQGRNQYIIAMDLFAKQTGKLPLIKTEFAAQHQIQIVSAGNHLAKLT